MIHRAANSTEGHLNFFMFFFRTAIIRAAATAGVRLAILSRAALAWLQEL
jgi:hypothetical protein